mmetsp:Transcript_18159/g.54783  ORF Transcript_18159/g.54783 Transcript_18159/m.54783 type:complete len:93 (-) Transcript_18159:123-401(-)|eukprot:scaffold26384_cov36-Tisochrysis_lutea.AAC.12
MATRRNATSWRVRIHPSPITSTFLLQVPSPVHPPPLEGIDAVTCTRPAHQASVYHDDEHRAQVVLARARVLMLSVEPYFEVKERRRHAVTCF